MIDENRIKHTLAVAKLMKDNATKYGLDEEEMFTLGMLHDIGYEFIDGEKHAEIGGEILKKQNYKYYKEVLFHGVVNCEYKSKELDLLNFADMHINLKGNFVSFNERLEDIKTRRGENSPQYINSKLIILELKHKNFE